MKEWPMKRQFLWIAILLLTSLTGCSSTGNVVRRLMNVEPLPKEIDIKGTVIVSIEMPQTTNQHPATRVFYLDSGLDLGCIEIPGKDLNKAHKKIEPFGTLTAKRRWPQPTLMGFGCPKVGSWKVTPNKLRSGRVNESNWRAHLWRTVRHQILLLAPAQKGILGDQFWPKEFPSELEGVFIPRQSTTSIPVKADPFEILRPITVPDPTAEDVPDKETGLDQMSSQQLLMWYGGLTERGRQEFNRMISQPADSAVTDAQIASLVARSTMAIAVPAFGDPWKALDGFHPRIHDFIVINGGEIDQNKEKADEKRN